MTATSGLSGLVALVSGAARGIGAATAEALAMAGASVVMVDQDKDGIHREADRLRTQRFRAIGFQADVTSDTECQSAVERAVGEFGKLDILVNNAGVGSFDSTIESTSEAEWDRVIGINLKGVFLLSRHAIPAIRQSGRGCIVNVSSIHAVATSSGVFPYAASKGGVLAMTRSMAIDLAKHQIRVVAVLPGATDTPMLQLHAERQGKTYAELGFATVPGAIGRVGRPEEVAQVIAFVASPAASMVNGAAILVDAGLLASFE
jgi:NAD(P)-dependent dehydrogenase (short-subunit alcohol dehydrogenase family)